MIDLSPWRNSLWLAEPNRLQRLVVQVAAYGRCFSREELVARRQHWREQAASIADGAVHGRGIDDPNELAGLHGTVQEKRADAPRAIRAVKGKVGVIPIYGPVDQRMTVELEKACGTPLDFVSTAFDNLMANASVGAIVLHVDSPGGSTYGTEELATKIFNARGTKPIYAMVDSMACSAAYWIGTSADMVICTPGGDVGSVGVYCMHMDQSKAMEEDGVAVTMISAGRYKTELSPFGPLSDDAKASLQESVDATHEKFIGALKRNRGTSAENVRTNYGEGRVVAADKALVKGMIDRIMPMETLMAKLMGGGVDAANGSKVKAEVLRMRHAQAKRKVTA